MLEINKYINAREVDNYDVPIAERINWLVDLSVKYSEAYCTPEAQLSRRRYMAKHPTKIIALVCMDGRIHPAYATKTPMGLIRPFRNIGGMFDLGWSYLGEVIDNEINYALEESKRILILITYHYSKGDAHRGCAGFNYDCEAAKKHVYEIKKQIEHIYGHDHQVVYPVICGIETDEDAFVLHGKDDEVLELATINETTKDFWLRKLHDLYPTMPEQVLRDFVPLAQGNIQHIKDIRNAHRNLELDSVHREWVICVGRGFDFLHVPNTALIIGPYSPDMSGPIAKAAGIIKSNMEKGMIPSDGFLLLASSPYYEIGVESARAELKAKFLSDYASDVIKSAHPELSELMIKKTAVLDWRSRNFKIIH